MFEPGFETEAFGYEVLFVIGIAILLAVGGCILDWLVRKS